MWRAALLLSLAAWTPADQQAARTVAALEVTLRNPADRARLIDLLEEHATQAGLHVDDGSNEWRASEARSGQIPADTRVTFNVGVWRGKDDAENEALADDRYHPGRVWITFPHGSQSDRSTRFRRPLIAAIQHWRPDAKMLPILPWGGLPHAKDLVIESGQYKIRRSAAPAYALKPSLPIFARD